MTRFSLNGLFIVDAFWHLWALATHHTDHTLISKFFLCFILFLLLLQQLGKQIPLSVLTSVLFCLVGDVLLQPLDLNYADMYGERPINFILGVLCFCIAYGNLARYFLLLNPNWWADINEKPFTCAINILLTVIVLIVMTINNLAPPYLLAVVWFYSPIVVGAATLAFYTRRYAPLLPYVCLVLGSNVIVLSDTLIGLTAYMHLDMPLYANPIWILGTYIIGIGLVFNAIIAIEKINNTNKTT